MMDTTYKIIVYCILGLLLSSSNSFAFLYTNDFRFQESLNKEHGRFYFIGSDYVSWSRKQEFNSLSTIYSYSFKDGTTVELYKADRPVNQIRYLPNSGMISFATQRSLYVVNEAGVRMGGFTDNSKEGFIPEYVWNHDWSKVVYLLAKGASQEGKPGPPYEPQGVWLYDFKAEKKTKIADFGMYLETDLERNYLYFRTADAAYRYEFSTGKLELYPEMKLKGLDFLECSVDRKYCAFGLGYMALDGEYKSSLGIFDNKKGEQMSPNELNFFKGRNVTTIIWGISSKYMAFKATENNGVNLQRSMYIYNFEENKVVERIDIRGSIVGISPDRSSICIYDYNNNNFILKEFPKN